MPRNSFHALTITATLSTALAINLLWIIPAIGSSFSEDKALKQTKKQPYKSYYYNYPHKVPSDYAYRTGRLFFPKTESGRDDTSDLPLAGKGDQLRGKIQELTSQLINNAQEDIPGEYMVAVSTFVNLNQLYSTSGLGRYICEQLMGELQMAGVEVIDIRKTPGLMIRKKHGEYSLSRDMDELSFVHPVQAVIVGTYTVADDQIFINARLLQNSDGMVLSSGSLTFTLDRVTQTLLEDEGAPVGSGTPVQVRALSN